MNIVKGYRVVVYEDYEPTRTIIASYPVPSSKLYQADLKRKPSLAKLVALIEEQDK